jgi:hypothetical protein
LQELNMADPELDGDAEELLASCKRSWISCRLTLLIKAERAFRKTEDVMKE